MGWDWYHGFIRRRYFLDKLVVGKGHCHHLFIT